MGYLRPLTFCSNHLFAGVDMGFRAVTPLLEYPLPEGDARSSAPQSSGLISLLPGVDRGSFYLSVASNTSAPPAPKGRWGISRPTSASEVIPMLPGVGGRFRL